MKPPRFRALAALASTALLGVGTGCTIAGASGASGASSASSPSNPVAAAPTTLLHLSGVLTLKGPELGAWWALTDDSGLVWRLEPADAKQAEAWRGWQNRRVMVEGTALPKLLNIPRLRVEHANLAP